MRLPPRTRQGDGGLGDRDMSPLALALHSRVSEASSLTASLIPHTLTGHGAPRVGRDGSLAPRLGLVDDTGSDSEETVHLVDPATSRDPGVTAPLDRT